jgi:hypothetical protein
MIQLAVAALLIAGCPDNADLMWCLKLKADSQMIPIGRDKVRFIPNEAMVEYAKRLKGN